MGSGAVRKNWNMQPSDQPRRRVTGLLPKEKTTMPEDSVSEIASLSVGLSHDVRPSHDQVVCTLFEGHYHFGLAVLINSMLQGGFKGLVWAGYRGALPPWMAQLKQIGPDHFELANGATLYFEKLDTKTHFTNLKPEFMLHLVRDGIAKNLLWYIDPDITVRCSWEFMTEWLDFGIALCEEVINGSMPERHPLRCKWVQAAKLAGWSDPVVPQTRYFNGGFIGLKVAYAGFLERWKDAIALAEHHGMDVSAFMKGSREDTFYASDQDTLNLAAMYAEEPLSPIGPEGMGFVPGGFTLYHSVGSPKPWRKPFVQAALQGNPPSNGEKHFLACAAGPIPIYTSSQLKRLRRSIAVASLIGRFYRRG
jgi:hypothetical protein